MKRHKFWIFSSENGEEVRGDCPVWARKMRRARPDMRVTVGLAYGPKWDCYERECPDSRYEKVVRATMRAFDVDRSTAEDFVFAGTFEAA